MTIFFDIGATLIQGPPQAPARQIAGHLGLDEAQRKQLDRTLLTGAITCREGLSERLVADFGANASAAASIVDIVWTSQVEGPELVPGARELLADLHGMGADYAFLSNIWHPYAESFLRLYGPLAEGRRCVFSYRQGHAKPDAALYRAALAATETPAHRCVMVGDSYSKDMAPAMAAGMKTVWLVHRPQKEAPWPARVDAGEAARPDVILPAVAELTPAILLDLIKTS